MLNKNLFLSKVVSMGYNQTILSSMMHMSKNTMNAKINGRSSFTIPQVDDLCGILQITNNDEKAAIFLAKVSQFRDVN